MSADRFPPDDGNGSLHLPSEILVEIFLLCTPPDHVCLSKPPQLLTPVSLTHVCSLWRLLALSTPRLWSRIVLGRHDANSAREIPIFDAWSARTGPESVSLDINIKYIPELNDGLRVLLDPDANSRYEEDTKQLIIRFCAKSRRLRTLSINVLDTSVLEPIFSIMSASSTPAGSLPSSTLPMLENLKITTAHLGNASGPHTLDFLALTCPRLRYVDLMCPPLLPGPSLKTPAFQHMQVLKLKFCTSVNHLMRWIDVCPNLEHLTVHLFCQSIDGDLEDPEIIEFDNLGEDDGWVLVDMPPQHPARSPLQLRADNIRPLNKLKYLEMRGYSSPISVTAVLDSLFTPALKTLQVSTIAQHLFPHNSVRWPHTSALLQRSNSSLESLHIFGTLMRVEDVCACLISSPMLKTIALGKFADLDSLLCSLTVSESLSPSTCLLEDDKEQALHDRPTDSTLLCPRLELLDISDSTFSTDILASLISSRFPSPIEKAPESDDLDAYSRTCLEELRVDTNHVSRVMVHPVIAECVSRGLKLTQVEPDFLSGLRVY